MCFNTNNYKIQTLYNMSLLKHCRCRFSLSNLSLLITKNKKQLTIFLHLGLHQEDGCS